MKREINEVILKRNRGIEEEIVKRNTLCDYKEE